MPALVPSSFLHSFVYCLVLSHFDCIGVGTGGTGLRVGSLIFAFLSIARP